MARKRRRRRRRCFLFFNGGKTTALRFFLSLSLSCFNSDTPLLFFVPSTLTRPPFFFSFIHTQTHRRQYYPDGELAAEATANARRYARLAAEAADAAMPPPTRGDLPDDVFDVLHRQVKEGGGYFDSVREREAMRDVLSLEKSNKRTDEEKKKKKRRRKREFQRERLISIRIRKKKKKKKKKTPTLPFFFSFSHSLFSFFIFNLESSLSLKKINKIKNSARPAPRPRGARERPASSPTRRTASPRTSSAATTCCCAR